MRQPYPMRRPSSGPDCFRPDAEIISTETQIVAKLSDSEYSHVQQLRAAVVEEEKKLAVKCGASDPLKTA